jgi:hypothetical protein
MEKSEEKVVRKNLEIMAWTKTQEAYNFIATNYLQLKGNNASMVDAEGHRIIVSGDGSAAGIAINVVHKGTGVEEEAEKIIQKFKGKYKKGFIYYCDMRKDPPEVEEKSRW